MATYKVEIPFRFKGKDYGAGDEIILNKDAGDRHTNLGYVKEVKAAKAKAAAKSTAKAGAKKGAAKGASKSAAKGTATTATEGTTDATE